MKRSVRDDSYYKACGDKAYKTARISCSDRLNHAEKTGGTRLPDIESDR